MIIHAKTRLFLYENKDAVTAQLISTLVYTDNSNVFLNPKFQASKFCDCVEGLLTEDGFSRAAALNLNLNLNSLLVTRQMALFHQGVRMGEKSVP